MKHLLSSVAFGLFGLGVAITAEAQILFGDRAQSWDTGELSKSEWESHRNGIDFGEKSDFDKKHGLKRPYSRENYQALQDKLTEMETRCWNGADEENPEDRRGRFSEYYNAFLDLYWAAEDPSTPEHVKEKWKKEYLAADGKGDLLKGCPPKKELRTEADFASDAYYERYDDTDWAATGSVSREVRDIPQSGYGVRILPATEEFVARTADTLSGYSYQVEVEWSDEDERKTPRFIGALSYTDLFDDASGQVENGTDPTGNVYHNFAPGGGTGVAIGNRGLDVSVESSFEAMRAEVEALLWADESNMHGVGIYGGVGISLEEIEHRASVTTPSFSDISSNSMQRVDEDLFYATAIVKSDWIVSNRFKIDFDAGLQFGLLDSGLDSEQQNICGLCAASDQNFIIDIQDEASKVFFGAKADAGATYKIGERLGLGINGGLFWRDKTGYAKNPETGDDLFVRNTPTELDFGEVFGAHFGVHVQTWW